MAAVAIAVVVAVGLVSCGSKEDGMTPEQARDTLVSTIEDSAALLPRVTGWNRDHAPNFSDCGAIQGTRVHFGYGYGAPQPGGDHAADAKTIADYWTSLGMTVHIDTSGGGIPVVFGEGGPVSVISFSPAPGDYYISGTSLCVPGDPRSFLGQH
ncbi:hypothetical protein [Microbacterium sp. SORGH_AS_0888]|uniref:hypothetical protein n=1 Tax=Microbacterium sp. SORGH_AS_0888 TaxID=3041791 RepID=UPI0027D81BC5|nr:hypothetical protein [Microbacterium sp. SORGH_AS_0888]